MSKATERAWAAGFFDGEGSTCRSGRGILVKVSQNERALLDRWVAAVGAGKVYGPYGPYPGRKTNSKAYYVAQTTNREASVKALLAMWPYLGDIKKAQASFVFD